MKRTFATMLVVAMAVANANAFAENKGVAKEIAKELVEKSFRINVSGVEETDVSGMMEIHSGMDVFYYIPERNLLFVGNIWDGNTNSNLTQAAKDKLAEAKVKNLPLDKAVKIGSGKNVVVEFSDPDCPYCRKASEFLDGRNDVTRYVFFSPLPFHKDAPAKSRNILCSKDGGAVYKKTMRGEFDNTELNIDPDCNKEAEERLAQHMTISNEMGVRGTPDFYINGVHVSGANIEAIKSIIEKGKN